MKVFTKEFTTFLILATILTLTFRILLSNYLHGQNYTMVWVIAILYGLLMFVVGFYTGKNDVNEFSLARSFLKWHGGIFVIWGLISYLWMFFGNPAPTEKLSSLNLAMIIWAICGTIVYFFIKYYTVKGVDKSEIFE